MALLLGLDIGTTSAKAVVFDEGGTVLGAGRARTPWFSSPDGVELRPADLIDIAVTAVAATPGTAPIDAVGITSMGESGVLVDGRGQPVAPIIAWHDLRDADDVEALRSEIGEDEFGATTGKPLRGQFSLTKHRWLKRHDPGLAQAVRRFNIAEYVVTMLGGDEACELSLASRTGWFDIAARRWWEEGLSFSGASASLMPPLVNAGDPVGAITSELVDPRLRGAVLTLVGHDHQAAAAGAGATGLGAELDSCGTAEALVRTVAPTLSRVQIMTLAQQGVTTDWSIHRGSWSLLAATEGGLAMQRALALLGVEPSGLAALDAGASRAITGRIAVGGLGTEELTLTGLRDGVSPAEVWRAVVDAVTAGAVTLHQAMASVVGPHRELVVTGGWSNSTALLQAKQRGFGPFLRSDVQEAGARGAAIFGARAAGLFGPDQRFDLDPVPPSVAP
jgi:sugar (pentulose or hexulose) kinase